ncbi:FAD:protein FMN transferase, partial [Hydrogenibacillus schlegelii]
MDPSTGRPAESDVLQATVLAADPVEAEALAKIP